MQKFYTQLKLGLDFVTSTLAVSSKSFPVSASWLSIRVNQQPLKEGFKTYPSTVDTKVSRFAFFLFP